MSFSSTLRSLAALAALGCGLLAACDRPLAGAAAPGAELRARLERFLADRRAELESHPDHLGLVFPVDSDRLVETLARVGYERDGEDFVLASGEISEPHGGGVLSLLLDQWRPDGRAATLEDRFTFRPNRSDLALRQLYDGYKRQVYLPPGEGMLPRMRFRFPQGGKVMETDAFKFLRVLIANEPDPAIPWTNHSDQTLSVDRLAHALESAQERLHESDAEPEDHSTLHLVELLLAYHGRWPGRVDPDAIRDRFLAYAITPNVIRNGTDEVLAHHVESLGRLLANADIRWTKDQRRQVATWLGTLEDERFEALTNVPVQELCHLLLGLRLVEEHWGEAARGAPGDRDREGV